MTSKIPVTSAALRRIIESLAVNGDIKEHPSGKLGLGKCHIQYNRRAGRPAWPKVNISKKSTYSILFKNIANGTEEREPATLYSDCAQAPEPWHSMKQLHIARSPRIRGTELLGTLVK